MADREQRLLHGAEPLFGSLETANPEKLTKHASSILQPDLNQSIWYEAIGLPGIAVTKLCLFTLASRPITSTSILYVKAKCRSLRVRKHARRGA